MKQCKSFKVEIFLAGSIEQAKQILRSEFSKGEGECVTITPTDYIYSFGEETGYVIQFINYARFPREEHIVMAKAKKLAYLIMSQTNQRSCTVMCDLGSFYLQIEDMEEEV